MPNVIGRYDERAECRKLKSTKPTLHVTYFLIFITFEYLYLFIYIKYSMRVLQ